MTKRYNILTRCLAAVALLFVYVASTCAILVGATTSSAQAQWRGRGYEYRGGWGRGRGWGPSGRVHQATRSEGSRRPSVQLHKQCANRGPSQKKAG